MGILQSVTVEGRVWCCGNEAAEEQKRDKVERVDDMILARRFA